MEQTSKTVTSTNVYDAFIAHKRVPDGETASALRNALHVFAKPPFRLRAMRVFLDRSIIRAGEPLHGAVRLGLEQSRYLILMACPECAVDGSWVDQETRHWFTALNRSMDRVIIVLTAGTITWNEHDIDWKKTDALPSMFRELSADHLASLRGRKYIDLRWARGRLSSNLTTEPRFEDAVAEISAAVRDMSKDAVWGEDLRLRRLAIRRARQTVLALTILLAGALAGGGAAWLQWERAERNTEEARAKFAETREMAEFLLEGVMKLSSITGAGAVREELLLRSHKHLARLTAERPDDPELQFGLSVMQALRGEVGQNVGDFDAAQADFTAAIPKLIEAARNDTTLPEATSVLYRALRYAIALHTSLGQFDEAHALVDQFRSLTQTHLSQTPSDLLALLHFTNSIMSEVELLKAKGQYKEARELASTALVRLESLNWDDEAGLLVVRADLYFQLANYAMLIDRDRQMQHEYLTMELEDREALASANPEHYGNQVALSTVYSKLSGVEYQLGQKEDARASTRRGYDLARRLTMSDPERVEACLVLADHLTNMSLQAEEDGDEAQAHAYADESQAIWRRLREAVPGNASYLQGEALADSRVANLRRVAGDSSGALLMLQAAADKLKHLCDLHPGNLTYVEMYAMMQLQVTEDAVKTGQLHTANEAAVSVEAMMPSIIAAHANDTGWRRRRARLSQTRAHIAMYNRNYGACSEQARAALAAYGSPTTGSNLVREVNVFRVRTMLEHCLVWSQRNDEAVAVRSENVRDLQVLKKAAEYDFEAMTTVRDYYMAQFQDFGGTFTSVQRRELLDAAKVFALRALDTKPNNARSLTTLLDIYVTSGADAWGTGDVSRAAEEFLACLERCEEQGIGEPSIGIFASQALWYLVEASFVAAPPKLDEAQRYAVRKLKIDETALALYTNVATYRHRRAVSLQQLLRIALAADRIVDAEDYGRQALQDARILAEENPQDGRYIDFLARTLAQISQLRRKQGRLDEAQALERESLDAFRRITTWPDAPFGAYITYTQALLQAHDTTVGDLESAKQSAQRAVELTGGRDSNSLAWLAEAFFKEGNCVEARKFLDDALRLTPEEAPFRKALLDQRQRYICDETPELP